MSYLTEHLSGLRQEITDLQNMNVVYLQRSQHSAIEKAESDVRGSRLLQIKNELSKMRSRPDDSVVWWARSPKPDSAA
jgi:3'-phosphoadenosine 5'-phosphosulfate sulfotransferase